MSPISSVSSCRALGGLENAACKAEAASGPGVVPLERAPPRSLHSMHAEHLGDMSATTPMTSLICLPIASLMTRLHHLTTLLAQLNGPARANSGPKPTPRQASPEQRLWRGKSRASVRSPRTLIHPLRASHCLRSRACMRGCPAWQTHLAGQHVQSASLACAASTPDGSEVVCRPPARKTRSFAVYARCVAETLILLALPYSLLILCIVWVLDGRIQPLGRGIQACRNLINRAGGRRVDGSPALIVSHPVAL